MNEILLAVQSYYNHKIQQYGPSPKGVDWNSEESQNLRFEQLTKVIQTQIFSINDLGCGYGKYFEYLKNKFQNFTYYGYDLSSEMILKAKELYPEIETQFLQITSFNSIKQTDYTIASGIFNVKLQFNEAEWLSYVLQALEKMNQNSIRGFAFNILTKYSDKEYMKENLYYADPLFFFDYCKRNFSKNIALLHDYELYEFTILVRK